MKLFCLAFALLAACVDATTTGTGTSDLDQSYACRTTADCPEHSVCGKDAECHAVTSTVPLPELCTVDADCPIHERCNPVCPTSTGIVRHVCQPEGLPTHQCP
jgi:hypothetical protein